jgi:hypothetical protein
MDFSDLPEAARSRIAAAETEADSILANSQAAANKVAAETHRVGADCPGIGYSPDNTALALMELTVGTDQAVRHLFKATVTEYFRQGKLDTVKLGSIGDWISQKYHPPLGVIDQLKQRFDLFTQRWTDTNLWTKEHLALFGSEMLGNMPPEDASSREFLDHNLKAVAGNFDIWAGAFCRTAVLTNDAAEAFEQLLDALEEAFLEQAKKRRLSFVPERLYSSGVKIRLMQRKLYWTGHMLRRVREHNEGCRANTLAATAPDAVVPLDAKGNGGAPAEPAAAVTGANGENSEPRFPRRASWLRDRLLERGWSNSDPYDYRGPDRKTIEKILRGNAVRNDVLEKLAVALSAKHAEVSVLGIPQD